jgi:hypothetical protein
MPIIVGIDGSSDDWFPETTIMGVTIIGAGRNNKYDKDFKDSFVSRICRKRPEPNKKYLRGPVQLGGGLVSAISDATDFVIERFQVNKEPVLLTGYSRGAAGAVCVAKKLRERNIYVKAMLLFDCVDRHLFVDAAVIPDNVENVHHVRRDPTTNSRNFFSNDGRIFAGMKGKYTEESYFCTHGAMGGVPWKPEPGQRMSDFVDEGIESKILAWQGLDWKGRTNVRFEQDARFSKLVWREVKPFMLKHGFYTE